jgi:hypothetical protein
MTRVLCAGGGVRHAIPPRALALACGLAAVAPSAATGADDFVRLRVPEAVAPGPGRFRPDFQYLFGTAARWPGGVLHWRYNHQNAPEPFLSDKTGTIDKISAGAAKWMAVCGVRIVYDGETAALPYDGVSPKPDFANVVGWRELNPGTIGITYAWDDFPPGGGHPIVDADIIFSPSKFSAPPPSSTAQMNRTSTHEWGHAIGIAHSNLPFALMSGLPDTPYSTTPDPQPDDVRACRCLYGPGPGQQVPFACSLPPRLDFGSQNVGAASPPMRVTLANDATATAPLAVNGMSVLSGEFSVDGTTCNPGLALAPGDACTIDFVVRPALAGTRNADAVITTSDGPYTLPLVADGLGLPPLYNVQGIWWAAPAGSESGWGLNIAHQGDTIFASWFTYDSSGRGAWYVMTAQRRANTTFAGDLYRTMGPAFSAVPWNPEAVTKSVVGNAILVFNDANSAAFAYEVDGIAGAKSITRQVFGPLPTCTFGTLPDLAPATNFQDLWWAAPAGSESGWGINLNHQGDTIFATWFTYDRSGAPLWLVATARKTGPAAYAGDLYRTVGPAFNAVPFDPAEVVATKVGDASFAFSDGNRGTFTYTVKLEGMTEPVTQAKAITREVFVAPGTACQ